MQVEQPPKQQIVDRVKKASNILVTVNRSPSVDLLVAALAMTLMLEKMDKSAVAVFSGVIPRAIDFLEPDKIIEDNVDSLRDFIIALDKDKADRLRYKVEGDVVRVYITPYKTTITEKDIKFSQGDFNVDLIIALGVEKSEDLDSALTAYGKIMHDAQIVTINNHTGSGTIGDVDWSDASASSYSEMIMSISEALQSGLLDQPIATSLLTGLVSSTDRFRNEKTSAKVMTMAAQLMAAGANQQLIAEQLSKSEVTATESPIVSKNPVVAPDNLSEISLRKDKTAISQDFSLEPELNPEPESEPESELNPEPETNGAPLSRALEKNIEPVSDLDNIVSKPVNDTMQDLTDDTNLMNNQGLSVPDLSLPPLPGSSADSQQQGGWRDISTVRDESTEPVSSQVAQASSIRPPGKVILNHEGDAIADAPTLNSSPLNAVISGVQEQPAVNTISGENTASSADSNQPQLTQTTTPGLSFEMPPLPGQPSGVSMSAPESVPIAPGDADSTIEALPSFDMPSMTTDTDEPTKEFSLEPVAPSAADDARAALSSIFDGGTTASPTPQQNPIPTVSTPNLPQLPQLPNLPMPDFSTLPPLPGEVVPQAPAQPSVSMPQPPQLGLPTPPAPAVAVSNDPAQFKLPGQ